MRRIQLKQAAQDGWRKRQSVEKQEGKRWRMNRNQRRAVRSIAGTWRGGRLSILCDRSDQLVMNSLQYCIILSAHRPPGEHAQTRICFGLGLEPQIRAEVRHPVGCDQCGPVGQVVFA